MRNSSTSFAVTAPLRLRLAWPLIAYVLIPHICALLPPVLLELPVWLRCVLLGAVVASLLLQISLHLWPATRIVRLAHLAGSRWVLTDGGGRRQLGRLTHWYVVPRLCVLRFRCRRGSRSVILPRSSLPVQAHRRLRAALRRSGSGAIA